MQGLLGNPVLNGLLSGGGPNGVRERARAEMAAMMPRASGGMIAAPAPQQSRGDGWAEALSSIGQSGARAIEAYAENEERAAQEAKIKTRVMTTLGMGQEGRNAAMEAGGGPTQVAAQLQVATPAARLAEMGVPERARQLVMSAVQAGDWDTADKVLTQFAMAKPETYTLGAGEVRFSDGQEVARGPAKPEDMKQAFDRQTGRLVFASESEIRASNGRLAPAGEKPGAPAQPKMYPVYDKETKSVTYATSSEIRASPGRYGPSSSAPDGGKYRHRTRPIDDQRQVFEVSFDGGMTWQPQGDPVARSVDPTAALMMGLFGGGSGLVDGEGQDGPSETLPASNTGGGSAPVPKAFPTGTEPAARDALRQAGDALRQGAPREAVEQRLRSMGIDPALLDR